MFVGRNIKKFSNDFYNQGYFLFDVKLGNKRKKNTYMCAFDGSDFIRVDVNDLKNFVVPKHLSHYRYLLFSDYTQVMVDSRLYQRCSNIDIKNFKLPKIRKVNGVPGCGKKYIYFT